MDRRVTDLWDRLISYQGAAFLPIGDLKEEVLTLHDAIEDEESRIGLMRIYNVLASLKAAELQETGGDLAAFEVHRASQIHLFLLAECRNGEYMDMHRLQYVTAREIRAGRMHEDDPLRRYALGDPSGFEPDLLRH